MSRGAKQRPVGKRRRAREMAMQMLYQYEQGGAEPPQIFDTFDVEDFLLETETASTDEARARRKRAKESFDYARRLVRGTLEDTESIDEMIRRHAENWRLERMPAIDRNILRLAIYEMLHEESVPKVVIVDEAIELAKKFGSESSGRFVNGLLDGVLKSNALDDPPSVGDSDGDSPSGDPNSGDPTVGTSAESDPALAAD